MTLLHISDAIFLHGNRKIYSTPNFTCQGTPIHVGSICSCMYFFKKPCRLCGVNTKVPNVKFFLYKISLLWNKWLYILLNVRFYLLIVFSRYSFCLYQSSNVIVLFFLIKCPIYMKIVCMLIMYFYIDVVNVILVKVLNHRAQCWQRINKLIFI